ncbi:MAG: metallophosphoesterase family protein [Spirochaetaceae bacterium]
MFFREGQTARIDPQGCRRILIFGDIHGDLASLEAGLALADSEDLVVFLGDYADRGPEGVEVIDRVFRRLADEPERTIALKGNHEDYSEHGEPKFHPCDLVSEARLKRGSWQSYFPFFQEFVGRLCLTAVIPGFALCVHAGVNSRLHSQNQLPEPDADLETAFLWNDPVPASGEHVSIRGVGQSFGPDISATVCEALSVRHIIRSHEPRKAAQRPHSEHDGRVITTSATKVYGGVPSLLCLETADLPACNLLGDSVVTYLT